MNRLPCLVSPISPPKTLGGTIYSAAVRVQPVANRDELPVIAFGTIQLVELVFGNRWRIVCKRAVQTTDIDVLPPGAGPGTKPVNTPIRSNCGGNVCATSEDGRAVSWRNATRRGIESDRDKRADSLRLIQGNTRWPLALVVLAEPYGYSPIGGVNYNPEEVLPRNDYVDLVLYDISPSQYSPEEGVFFGTIVFDPDSTIYPSCIVRADPGAVLTTLTRAQFTPTGATSPDPFFLPPTASLPGTSYWFDPVTYQFRVSPGALAGATFLISYYWLAGMPAAFTPPAETPAPLLGLLGDGTAGYGSAEDTLARAGFGTSGDFDLSITWQGGEGGIEWRTVSARNSPMLAAVIASGAVASIRYRATASGSASVVATPAHALTIGDAIRFVKSGANLSIYAGATLLHTQAMSGVATPTSGILGVANASASQMILFSVPAGRELQRLDGGDLALYRSRQDSAPLAQLDVGVGDDPEPTAVYNEGADVAMGSGGTARNQYQEASGTLRFSTIHNGDRVRITYPGQAPAEGYRGRAPRVPEDGYGNPMQENFGANVEGSDPVEATANAAENKANWHDVIEIEWPLPGDFPGQVGDTFEIVRGAAFSAAPTIDLDRKADAEGDWTAASGALALPAEGLILLPKTAVDALPEATRPAGAENVDVTGDLQSW